MASWMYLKASRVTIFIVVLFVVIVFIFVIIILVAIVILVNVIVIAIAIVSVIFVEIRITSNAPRILQLWPAGWCLENDAVDDDDDNDDGGGDGDNDDDTKISKIKEARLTSRPKSLNNAPCQSSPARREQLHHLKEHF